MKILFLILTFLIACSSPKEQIKLKESLPKGNVEQINDSLSQIAPNERPDYYYSDDKASFPYLREISQEKSKYNVMSSAQIAANELSLSFIEESWREYLTSNIESISFLSKDRGFITFSHPFAPEFAKRFNINLKSQSGGTDIYEFALNPEKGFEFDNLAPLEALNTSFWESHPFGADTLLPDGRRVTLLLWSSDRDQPYSKTIDKEGEIKQSGNTDLFYAFRIDEQWSNVKKFENLNNDFNQGSPFIYCLCGEETTLFYSSNEDGHENDFDIFYNRIIIDYNDLKITTIGDPKRFLKLGSDSLSKTDSLKRFELINTNGDERFPFIPYPYSDDLKLYFSSNRFTKVTKTTDSTAIKSKGKYDIYSLNLDNKLFPCKPEEFKIKYHLTVLNSADSTSAIPEVLVNVNNDAKLLNNDNKTYTYLLDAEKEYSSYAGSKYSDEGFDCQSLEEGVLSGYTYPNINYDLIEYEQNTSSEIIKLNIENNKIKIGDSKTFITYDTINYNNFNLINKIINTSTIINIDKKNNNYESQINRTILSANKSTIDLILGESFRLNNNKKIINSAEVPSVKTLKSNLNTLGITNNTDIYDTVYLAPVYKDAYDINLKVFVIDKCTGKQVLNPIAEIFNSKGYGDSNKKSEKGYLEFKLKCGETYRVFGGSNYSYSYKGNKDFPEKPYLRYFSANDMNKLVQGTNVESESTMSGGISTQSVQSNISLTDTVYLNATPNIEYSINIKNAKRLNEKIKEAVILIKNVTTNKELKIDDDKYSFYPNPNHEYLVYGGSNYDGMECEDNKDYLVRSYYGAKFENGMFKLKEDFENLDLSTYRKVKGAIIPSLFSYSAKISVSRNEDCKTKVINDIVYLIPEEYIKPPCSVEFVNFEGYHKNVPYFQTGFWEVNTVENIDNHINRLEEGFNISSDKIERNKSDYTVVGESAMYPLLLKDNSKYSIANSRWIELHPNNYYWGWRPDLYLGANKERVEKRENRKKEYKEYASKVSENLDIMVNSIANDVLPKFEELLKLNPKETGTKLLIEIKALSDKRGVDRGWYVGENDIKYNAGYYDKYSEQIIKRKINIAAPAVDENKKYVSDKVNLGLSNRVLSDLRAWFGYKEIYNRLNKKSIFKNYISNNKVYNPEIADSDLNKYDIIILANGEDIDEYADAKIKMYDKSKRKISFFTYDQTRRIEVIISIVNYQNGKLIKSDCCNEDVEFSNKGN